MPVADSLRYTSALSVALAVVFLVITVGISIIKLIGGGVAMPRLLPDITDLASFWKIFTVVPVLVTAYICHYNGMLLKIAPTSKSICIHGNALFV